MQQQIIDKQLRFFVIDASKVAQEVGLRGRTNTVLQTCFFAISGVLPREEAIAPDQAVDPEDLRAQGRGGRRDELRRPSTTRWRACSRSRCPATATSGFERPPLVPDDAPDFVRSGDRRG